MGLIERDGRKRLPRKATNHRQFKHLVKRGRVTISGKECQDVSPRDLDSILKQAA